MNTEREKVFREIAEALLDGGLRGSCHGCDNVGDDCLAWLKDRFPDDLPYVTIERIGGFDVKAKIDE